MKLLEILDKKIANAIKVIEKRKSDILELEEEKVTYVDKPKYIQGVIEQIELYKDIINKKEKRILEYNKKIEEYKNELGEKNERN